LTTEKYIVRYEGFSDSDTTNNYISVTTKSSSNWSDSANDGKLKQGRRSWKVKATDSAGNQGESSRNIFVDFGSPNISVSSFADLSYKEGMSMITSNTKPTIEGTITDLQVGNESVASSPRKLTITLKQQGRLISSSDITKEEKTQDFNYYSIERSAEKHTDFSDYDIDKYVSFSYTPNSSLLPGTYSLTLVATDRAGNSASKTYDFTIGNTYVTSLEIKEVEELDSRVREDDKKTTQTTNEKPEEKIQRLTETKTYEVDIAVKNSDGNPIEGALVTLHSDPKEAYSDKNGIAHFSDVPYGEHTIVITYDDFVGEEVLSLTDDQKESYDVAVTVKEKPSILSIVSYGFNILFVLTTLFGGWYVWKRKKHA